MMFFWYILFTSSQNLRIYEENSQAQVVRQTKCVDLVSDCSFSGWALLLVTLAEKKESYWEIDTNLISIGILGLL